MYQISRFHEGAARSLLLLLAFACVPTQAEETPVIEEIVVTGTHIKGLSEESLPVTVMDDEAMKHLGAVNMLDLLAYIPSISDFEFEDSNTGTNGARGDVAGVNMRSIGSGNTLVLLNGRRMVVHPTFQAINSVPTTFYNVNAIPSSSIQRIEVLRDGASALYGADASAGVVNFIPYSGMEGAEFGLKYGASDDTDYDELELVGRGGWQLNDGRTTIGLFGTYYERSKVAMEELDDLYFDLDRRTHEDIPEEWQGDSQLRNTSTLTPYARVSVGALSPDNQFIGSTRHVDSDTGALVSGSGSERYNFNEPAWVTPKTDRFNLLATLNHDFDNGLEFFGDVSYYKSESNTQRAASPLDDSLAFLIVPPDSYHNPTGQEVLLLGWRPVDLGPRIIEVNQDTWRILGGLRGEWGNGWEWESALVFSEAESEDTEGNRQAKSLFTSQLEVDGPDALNPFVGPGGNTQAALDGIRIEATDVRTSRLGLWDVRLNKADLFSAPGGDVGLALGAEWRYEYYRDDRDARLDGSMPFSNGPIFDESDVIGVSATYDSKADRNTGSLYGELFIPLVGAVNEMALAKAFEIQLAARYENTSDFEDTLKPKIGLRWEPIRGVSLRASYSEGFRAPNLPQMNQGTIVRRIDGIEDPLRADVTGLPIDTGQTYRVTTRVANDDLEPEDTKTWMAGVVIAPGEGPLSGFTVIWDFWNIEQKDVVGLLDPSDALDLDALLRSQGSSNPNVERAAVTAQDQAAFDAWNLANPGDQRTAVGVATNVINQYINLDPREVEGWDASIQWVSPETAAGTFTVRGDTTHITKFEQQGLATTDLLRRNGNPEWRATASLGWALRGFSANLSMRYVGSAYDSSLWQSGSDVSGTYDEALDRTYWDVDSWTVWNLGLRYDFAESAGRLSGLAISGGVRNLGDEKPPFADESFGYLTSLHNSYGRVFWAEMRYGF